MKNLKFFLAFSLAFYLLLFGEVTHAEEKEKYYTILLDKNANVDDWIEKFSSNSSQIIYMVKEVGLLQIKTTSTNMKMIGNSSSIRAYNQSINNNSDNLKDLNKEIFSESSLWHMQWDMQKITNNGESYKVFPGTKNVTVGIVDSGIDINHPDLKDNIVVGSKNLIPSGGFRGEEIQETGDINQINDINGHGTLVAGQVAANGRIKGVAPGIGIKSYRALGQKKSENIWIIKGIIEAAKDDVDVINVSLGSYLVNGIVHSNDGHSVNNLAEIEGYKRAIQFAKTQGSVVVAAVGNDSLNLKDSKQMNDFFTENIENGTIISGKIFDAPASFDDVVAVASVNLKDELSVFSNYGEGIIDIAAPGGDLRLFKQYGENDWINKGFYLQETVFSTWPGGYFATCGNSLAAPKVSGTLALIIDQNNYKQQPEKSIDFLYKYGINSTIKNNRLYGHGILDVDNAVKTTQRISNK
ncbi:S8 family serine peptidase [Bacillus mycoides]|uniref:S8 family peptidase n=1 Tax=Bacillus mycoides TaxID=1405 RepID=UPI003D1EE8F2